jgi:DNA gyrase subunit B
VSRYKGLGEMTATQLWDTTMNPAVRKLFQVDVQDAAAASETIEVFLGAEVAPRRRWIEAHAEEARNIDTVV